MNFIYESPDEGKTVYKRPSGKMKPRTLIIENGKPVPEVEKEEPKKIELANETSVNFSWWYSQ